MLADSRARTLTRRRVRAARAVRSAVLGVLAAALALSSACTVDSFRDEFSTSFDIEADEVIPGETLQIFKRFRLTRSPDEVSDVALRTLQLNAAVPDEADLSFLHRVTVTAIRGDEEVLIAVGQGFVPGQQRANLEIVFDGDLRPLVTTDRKITLAFAFEPLRWNSSLPAPEITIFGRAIVDITL